MHEQMTFTRLEGEAALCLWEAMNDARCASPPPQWAAPMLAHWEASGSVQMRHHALDLAAWACRVFDLIPEEDRDGFAYDWEVIPAILAHVGWQEGANGPIEPAAADVAAAVAAELRKDWAEGVARSEAAATERKADADAFEDWRAKANAELKRRFGIDYEDGAGRDVRDLREWFDEGQTPEELADWFGRKYDLDPVEG